VVGRGGLVEAYLKEGMGRSSCSYVHLTIRRTFFVLVAILFSFVLTAAAAKAATKEKNSDSPVTDYCATSASSSSYVTTEDNTQQCSENHDDDGNETDCEQPSQMVSESTEDLRKRRHFFDAPFSHEETSQLRY